MVFSGGIRSRVTEVVDVQGVSNKDLSVMMMMSRLRAMLRCLKEEITETKIENESRD